MWAVPTLSRTLEFNMRRTAPRARESPQEHGQDFGRRPYSSPRPPEDSLQGRRALVPAPEAHAAARRPRPQFGKLKHPNREPGPIPGGWAGPTMPAGDEIPQGEFKGIPGPFDGSHIGTYQKHCSRLSIQIWRSRRNMCDFVFLTDESEVTYHSVAER